MAIAVRKDIANSRVPVARQSGALYIPFDRTGATPYYRQVYRGIREAILEGRLDWGQRLPSTRTLARDLGISRLPILNAYEQLLHEGYLIGRVGSGTFVSTRSLGDTRRASREPSSIR